MRLPAHGRAGLLLVALAWALNWSLPGLRTHLLFFPLWLGYCLSVDGIVLARTGDSLMHRGKRRYAGLFVASVPAWWLFELLNRRTGNWQYLGRSEFSGTEYFLLASLSFSTVMPAVFGTAELVRSSRWIERFAGRRALLARDRAPARMEMAGWSSLLLVLGWPHLFFPLLWVALWLILEPINLRLGNRTLIASLRQGDLRPAVSVAVGALICGGFWELWNWRSYPKWIYHVPYVGFLHVFEMPLLGYGGYVPFGLELFALYQLISGVAGVRGRPVRL